ncbi:MAG: hypothetical protein KAT69_06300 [Candidatus Aminicenantes bacterium]|nr:hypothetical protein [Candidatus Aminicenantes bacterium]
MRKPGLSKVSLISAILAMTIALFAPTGRLSAGTQNEMKDQARLQEILRSTGEYCERVKQIALHYICQENVIDIENFFHGASRALGMQREEKVFNIRRVKRRTYRYDYQLVRKGDDLSEQRIMLEKNGKKKHQENADLSHLKYYSQYLIFGPVGFLSQYWQNHFTYSLIGEDMIDGEPAFIIQADPNEVRLDNYNIGRIWVNEDFQIVRVAWEPASIQNYEDEILISRLGPFQKKVVWTVDYTVEKNGVRFPGRQFVQEIFFRNSENGFPQKAVKRETHFEYNAYKFFIVETDVRFQKEE